MYGLSRTNIPRPVSEHPSIGVLRSKGFGAVSRLDGSFLIAGTVLFWPKIDFWKRDEQTFGYGIASLVRAVLPSASIHLLPPVDHA